MRESRLARMLRWGKVLGWSATVRNLMAVAFCGRMRRLSVPGISSKITVRANDSDLAMFEQVFVAGDYEFDPGFVPATIIDAGANAGYASLFFHRRFPKAHIVAIEPDAENWEMLRANTRGIPLIQTVKGGLWSSHRPLRIADPAAQKCMISLAPADDDDAGGVVDGYGVAELMGMAGADVLDLLKIDIEGAELELFSENYLPWIGKVRVFMVELHDRMRPGCAAAFYHAIRDLRFTQHQKGDIVMIRNEDLVPK